MSKRMLGLDKYEAEKSLEDNKSSWTMTGMTKGLVLGSIGAMALAGAVTAAYKSKIV